MKRRLVCFIKNLIVAKIKEGGYTTVVLHHVRFHMVVSRSRGSLGKTKTRTNIPISDVIDVQVYLI